MYTPFEYEFQALAARSDVDNSTTFGFYTQCFNVRNDLEALRTLPAPSFVNSPEIRGTLSITWSCIATLIACVITALHVNIPNSWAGMPLWTRKFKWASAALLAPEIAVYVSTIQFIQARQLKRELTEYFEEIKKKDKEEGVYRRRPGFLFLEVSAIHSPSPQFL